MLDGKKNGKDSAEQKHAAERTAAIHQNVDPLHRAAGGEALKKFIDGGDDKTEGNREEKRGVRA